MNHYKMAFVGYIYAFTNKVNGKVYIGSTVDMKKRLKDHLYLPINPRVASDFKTFGKDKFEMTEIMHLTVFSKEELWLVEDTYIAMNDTIHSGYNYKYNTFHVHKYDRQGETLNNGSWQ